MFAAIRFKHLVIVGTLLSGVTLSPPAGYAQLPPPPPTPRGCPVSGCNEGDSSGGSPGGAIGDLVRLPGDLIRKHNEAKARKVTALNDQGMTAYAKKDWAAAEAYFKKALDLDPSNAVIRQSLGVTQNHEGEDAYRKSDYTTALYYFQQAMANVPEDNPGKHFLRESLASTQGQIAAVQQDKIAASKMQHSIQNLAQSLSATPSSNAPPSSGGLIFMDSDHPLKDAVADSQPAPSSTQPSQGASTCTFNTTCNPANPNLGDSSSATSTANSGTGALNQARVAAGQGNVARQTTSNPSASEAAGHPFDTPGGVVAPMPVVVGSPASAPVPDRIKNTPEYKTMAAEKEKLQNRMNALDTRLTAIRAEQAKSQAPNQALVMEAAKIKQEMSPIPGEMLLTQQKIDKFVVSMEEESVPDKGKDKTPPKTAVTVPSPTQ